MSISVKRSSRLDAMSAVDVSSIRNSYCESSRDFDGYLAATNADGDTINSMETARSVEIKGDKLHYFDERRNNDYYFYKTPMRSAAIYILVQEMCERLAFYGITPNLQGFLHEYLDMSDANADSYIAVFNGLIYFTPLVSAIIADTWLGLYRTILVFSVFYMTGLILLSLSSIQDITEPWMIHLSLMGFIALGTGGIKSCVNVFGAQQFHPVEHASKITSYYTWFYAVINIGALVGGILCPILQQDVSYFASFMVPTASFFLATSVFVLGSKRYVLLSPQGSVVLKILRVLGKSITSFSLEKLKKSNGGRYDDCFIDDTRKLFKLLPLFTLTIPFMIAYGQMTTAYLSQGKKMDSNLAGWDMNPALMQNVDAISVIIVSILVDSLLYPYLRSINRMPSVLTRFAIGNIFGMGSLLCAFAVEEQVRNEDLYSISIFSQIPQFFLIAAGEIFLVSTSYEVAFTRSPSALKAVASAFNLLFISIANFISAALFQACKPWLKDKEHYRSSHYDYFFLLLCGICFLGVIGSIGLRKYWKSVEAA